MIRRTRQPELGHSVLTSVIAGRLSRPARRLSLAAGLLLLGACSGTTFVYNRMDFILPWYVDGYTELDTEQEQYLDEILAPFLDWHRDQELPQYLALIEQIETDLDRPVTVEDIESVAVEFEQAWFRLEGEALDWLLDLGGKLSDDQVDYFMTELWEKQREYEEEYLERSEEEFYEDNYDNMKDTADDYLGRLSREQKNTLEQNSRKLQRSDTVWLQERALWLSQLETFLQREPGWEQRIRDAIAARDEAVSEEYLDVFEHNIGVINETVVEILNGRTEKQDAYLRNKLAGLRKDLKTLIAQSETSQTAG